MDLGVWPRATHVTTRRRTTLFSGGPVRRALKPSVWFPAAAVLLVSYLCQCGSAVSMWPLRRGQAVAAAELGGPVVNLGGAQLPVPYTVARMRYGITDRLNVNLGGHLLMPAFGVAAFDAGASYHFLDQAGWRPCLGIGAGEIGLLEFDGGGGTSFLPQLEVTASYLRPSHSLSYFGVHTLYQIRPRFYMTYSPYVGHNFKVGRRVSVSLEMKWYAAYERTKPRAVTFTLPIANHGGLGFVAGASYHFGGWYR
jgi:hypothetical protein